VNPEHTMWSELHAKLRDKFSAELR